MYHFVIAESTNKTYTKGLAFCGTVRSDVVARNYLPVVSSVGEEMSFSYAGVSDFVRNGSLSFTARIYPRICPQERCYPRAVLSYVRLHAGGPA